MISQGTEFLKSKRINFDWRKSVEWFSRYREFTRAHTYIHTHILTHAHSLRSGLSHLRAHIAQVSPRARCNKQHFTGCAHTSAWVPLETQRGFSTSSTSRHAEEVIFVAKWATDRETQREGEAERDRERHSAREWEREERERVRGGGRERSIRTYIFIYVYNLFTYNNKNIKYFA